MRPPESFDRFVSINLRRAYFLDTVCGPMDGRGSEKGRTFNFTAALSVLSISATAAL